MEKSLKFRDHKKTFIFRYKKLIDSAKSGGILKISHILWVCFQTQMLTLISGWSQNPGFWRAKSQFWSVLRPPGRAKPLEKSLKFHDRKKTFIFRYKELIDSAKSGGVFKTNHILWVCFQTQIMTTISGWRRNQRFWRAKSPLGTF